MTVTDEELLGHEDAGSFELFYDRHFERVLAFFARRTVDPELAADLTAETFAAVLVARRRYRRHAGAASSWLSGLLTTSSPTPSGRATPTIELAGDWGSSGSSSPTTTSRASTGW